MSGYKIYKCKVGDRAIGRLKTSAVDLQDLIDNFFLNDYNKEDFVIESNWIYFNVPFNNCGMLECYCWLFSPYEMEPMENFTKIT